MNNKLIDLVLHPARLRMLRELAGEALTAQQLSVRLADIPQATIYRHLNRLVDAGLLSVVEERPVRGTLEKVYTANPQGTNLSPADMQQMSKEDHMRLFIAFTTTLLHDFEHYLSSTEDPDFAAHGVGFRQVKLYLSDEEFIQMVVGINAAVLEHVHNLPAPGRRQRLFSTIVMPSSGSQEPLSNSGKEVDLPAGESTSSEH